MHRALATKIHESVDTMVKGEKTERSLSKIESLYVRNLVIDSLPDAMLSLVDFNPST